MQIEKVRNTRRVVLQYEEKVVQYEETVYSVGRASSAVEGQVCSLRRKSALPGESCAA